MQIKLDRELVKNEYTVEFKEVELSHTEKADFENAVVKFDYPVVDFGGSFTEETEDNGNTVTVEVFKFNENLRKIPEALPYKRTFKVSQYGTNAEKYADLYATTLEKRITDAFDELKGKVDTFSSNDKDIFY